MILQKVYSVWMEILLPKRKFHIKKNIMLFYFDDAHGIGVLGDGTGSTSLFNKAELIFA